MTRRITIAGLFFAVAMQATLSSGSIVSGSGSGFNIPDNDPSGITSSIVISADEEIADVEVTLNNLSHSWAGDLKATLSNGTSSADLVVKVGDPGGTSGDSSTFNGNYGFKDGGADLWTAADNAGFGSPIAPGTYAATGAANVPVSLIGTFAGGSTAGTWTLSMSDAAQGDTGALGSWDIAFQTNPGQTIPEPTGVLIWATLAGLGMTFRRRR